MPTRSQRLALAASADAVSNKKSEQHWLSDLLWKCFEVFTLFRKWTRWVVIGRRIDSAGVLLLSLRYLRWCHAYIQDNVKQDGMWWKSKGISFVIMYHLSRRWTSFPMLTSASLKNYLYKFWPLWRISPEEGQFCSINLWWYRSVAVPWVNNKHQNLPLNTMQWVPTFEPQNRWNLGPWSTSDSLAVHSYKEPCTNQDQIWRNSWTLFNWSKIFTVVMCSSVISSLTPQRMSTT